MISYTDLRGKWGQVKMILLRKKQKFPVEILGVLPCRFRALENAGNFASWKL